MEECSRDTTKQASVSFERVVGMSYLLTACFVGCWSPFVKALAAAHNYSLCHTPQEENFARETASREISTFLMNKVTPLWCTSTYYYTKEFHITSLLQDCYWLPN